MRLVPSDGVAVNIVRINKPMFFAPMPSASGRSGTSDTIATDGKSNRRQREASRAFEAGLKPVALGGATGSRVLGSKR